MQFVKKNDNLTELYIYGDIRSPGFLESLLGKKNPRRTDSFDFKEELKKVDTENLLVRINSYGGSVSEALAIYNQLQNFPGIVTTMVDGFACSAASVIFMAGKNRVVPESGLLMIHNASSSAAGDYRDLKKAAEDLEKIQQPSVDIYISKTGLSEDKVRELMDEETWINSKMAFELGFATTLEKNDEATQAIEARFLTKMVEKLQNYADEAKNLKAQIEMLQTKENSNKNGQKKNPWDDFF